MKFILIAIVSFILVSCTTVRVVSKQPGKGGVVAVHQGLIGGDANVMAKGIMKENCGGKRVEVLEEGESVIGTTSKTDTKKVDSVFTDSTSSTDTTNKTEWRIKYKCISGGGKKK